MKSSKKAKLNVFETFSLKAYDNLLEFKATENVFSMSNVWQEIWFKSWANLNVYNNLLEFKATENVFSMSNVWQQIGFKSWANLNVLEIFNSKAYNNLLEFKSLSKSNAMCVLKHFIWKSISKSRKWSINTKDIFVFSALAFGFHKEPRVQELWYRHFSACRADSGNQKHKR